MGQLQAPSDGLLARHYTPSANMADHSVVAWNELYESEASWASVFCFDNASSEKSCFVRHLVFFISLRLRVFMFVNATRRDRNCPAFASKGKKWIHAMGNREPHEAKKKSFDLGGNRELTSFVLMSCMDPLFFP